MVLRPTIADLYCGGGLGADGYVWAGFRPEGVDLYAQPHYPYPFKQADALDVLSDGAPELVADVIHASPPCQLFTRASHLRDAQGATSKEALDLLTPTLRILRERFATIPWVVENVEAARPLMQPQPGEFLARVCGSSFGLEVQRHRLFLSNVAIMGTRCDHSVFPPDPVTGKPRPWGVYHVMNDNVPSGGRTVRTLEQGHEVMGMTHRQVPWNTLKEGFPPAYTEHIGKQIKEVLA